MYRLLKISDFEKMCLLMIDLAILENKTKSRNPGCHDCGKYRMYHHHNLDGESTSKGTYNDLNYLNCDEPKRVAIYIRTLSNDSSLKYTFENQSNHYNTLMQKHPNWKIIDIYSDEVFVDGKINIDYGAFKRLISACKSGEIDLIITKNIILPELFMHIRNCICKWLCIIRQLQS